MLKIAVIFVFISTVLLAETAMEKYYNGKEYIKACEYGASSWRENEKNEAFMIMFGNSCMNANNIDYLAVPSARLYKTKSSRESAAMYSTLLTKKKLLFMAMSDGVDLSGLALPQAPHILSVAFDKMVAKDFIQKDGKWVAKDGSMTLTLVPSKKDSSINSIVITDSNNISQTIYK